MFRALFASLCRVIKERTLWAGQANHTLSIHHKTFGALLAFCLIIINSEMIHGTFFASIIDNEGALWAGNFSAFNLDKSYFSELSR